MMVRASGPGVEVWAPAKINLFLEVLRRREDGFHEIETLMFPVSLFDTLFFWPGTGREAQQTIKFSCRVSFPGSEHSGKNSGHGPVTDNERCNREIPQGPDNLAVRAVELLRERAGVAKGASMALVKRIPAAAGLGGGSSDAAAALAAANLVWRLGYSPAKLRELAAEMGSDVPFFFGGPAVARGRGERIEAVPSPGNWHFVIACPHQGLSTAEVYRQWQPAAESRGEPGVAAQSPAPLIEALHRGRASLAGARLHNALRPAAGRLCPAIERLAAEFDRLPVAGHQMSGSGTSYFGLCSTAGVARRAAARLRGRGVGRVFAVRGIL